MKFGIALLLLGLSVGMVGSVATGLVTDEVRNNVNAEYQNLADAEATTIERWNKRNEVATRQTANSEVLRSDDSSEITLHLQNKKSELYTDVFAVHVVGHGQQGDPVRGSTSMRAGASFSENERPWISEVEFDQVNEVHLSDVYAVGGTPVVGFVSPVGGGENRLLVVEVRVADVATADFQGADKATGGFTQVVDSRDGTIVFDERGEEELETYGDGAAMKPVNRGNDLRMEGPATDTLAGVTEMPGNDQVIDERYIVGYAPVQGTPWVVVTHAPSENVYGAVTTIRQYGYVATLSGVLLVGLVGAVLGRNTAGAIDRLTAKTQRMEEGDLSVDFSTHRVDNIGRLYEAFAAMRDTLRDQIEEAEQARRRAEQAQERTERMNRHLERKADEYSQVMQRCAAGNLSLRLDPDSDSEAMVEIGQAFNTMVEELERTTEEVKQFASEVAASSEEVTASSEEVRNASESVSESTQEIADGARRQNENLQSVSEEMSDLSSVTEEIAASSNRVAQIAERTAETGNEGREAAQEAISGMNQIEAESSEAVTAIESLVTEVEQIDELMEFITDVAEQTNVLALNANIEAARAGEAGEGFAVVAEEVKSLAEETREAAEDIERRLEGIQDQTQNAASEVRQTSQRIARERESVENAVEALDEIAGYAAETNDGVQEISAASQQQASSTEEVVTMVDEAATISEQTTAEAQNVAAAAEQASSALVQMSQNAGDLTQQATRLRSMLDDFETDVSLDDGPRSQPAPSAGSREPARQE